jgi:hypothetical protein
MVFLDRPFVHKYAPTLLHWHHLLTGSGLLYLVQFVSRSRLASVGVQGGEYINFNVHGMRIRLAVDWLLQFAKAYVGVTGVLLDARSARARASVRNARDKIR